MRLLVLYLMMSSGLFAEDWFTLTLKDGEKEWILPDGAEHIEEVVKGRGVHLVAPGDTKMDMFSQWHSGCHVYGNGRLKLSLKDGKEPGILLGNLTDDRYFRLNSAPRSSVVGISLVGNVLSVGVHGKTRRVFMHIDGTGKKSFNQSLEAFIKLETKNENRKSLVTLDVSPLNTLEESMKALKIAQKNSTGSLLFQTELSSSEYTYPGAWRYPGLVGRSLLDPRTRIDIRLDYNAENNQVFVLTGSGVKLSDGEQLLAYYKKKMNRARDTKKPAWLCLEGTVEFLSGFGELFVQKAANAGIDFVVCRAPGTKLKLEPLDVNEYVFSIDDLKLSVDDVFRRRPILRALDEIERADDSDPLILNVTEETIVDFFGEDLSSEKKLESHYEEYSMIAQAMNEKLRVFIYCSANISDSRVREVLEVIRWNRGGLTPLVVYRDWAGKTPERENIQFFGTDEEYKRLEKQFK